MRKPTKYALVVILVLGILGVGYYTLLSTSLFGYEFSDEVIAVVPSPSNDIEGRVLIRNIGAFSSFNTLVTIGPSAGNQPHERADTIIASCAGSQEIALTWISDTDLRVVLPAECERRPNELPLGLSAQFVTGSPR